MEEPKILIYIKEFKSDAVFDDTKNEIIPFLKSQFDYEIQRVPHHNLFKSVYQLNYFDATKFLNYWIYPSGVGLFEYKIDEYSHYNSMIHKRATKNINNNVTTYL